ncbi:MAG: DUF763 domain-containing protein [Candidatus Micrarchaeaceae archaeon]
MHQITVLPLHHGKAPRWLFNRMVKLGGAISEVIIDEFGADGLLARLSDSNWLQALACTIGYDWHSSGSTTVTMGALKEALNSTGCVFIAGGKGNAGKSTPDEIEKGCDLLGVSHSEKLVEFSRLAAKVDSSMVYDKIGIYHHTFAFSESGKWCVVQQAMRYNTNEAIRFQWFSETVDENDIANEPHSGISTTLKEVSADLTYEKNKHIREGTASVLDEARRIVKEYPSRHEILPSLDISKKGIEIIERASELSPKDYKELLLIKGVGRSTIRSLAFIASLIYNEEIAYRDPVAFSYNLGGKDGIPFRVNKRTYDSVIEAMRLIVDNARIERREKYLALRRLSSEVAGEKGSV